MATVLRIGANILIRLREKMEVHLCTVFHSTRNTITLKRYASILRMLQEPARNPSETPTVTNKIKSPGEFRGSAQVE